MKYIYRAKKGPDETVENAIEAASQDAAVARIIEQGLVPVLVEEESEYLARKSQVRKIKAPRFSFKRKVSKAHIEAFTKQLRVLLKSQVPILNSLYIMESQVTNINFKIINQGIIESVRDGANFSDSLEKFPQHFTSLYISIVKAGEASGKLDYSLEQIMKYLDRERQLSQKVKSSLAYPAVMITVGMATVIFLMTFVVPRLNVLFEDFIERLPLATKMLLGASLFLSKYWMLLLGLFVLFILFLVYTKATPWQRKVVDNVKKKIPLVKDIIYNQALARFARSLSVLLDSGVSVLDSLRIAIPQVDDALAQKELEGAYKQIVSGTGLEDSLKNNCSFLPDMFVKMVAIGEASGRLDEILAELADSYTEEVETKTKIVASLIEPLAILVVGAILAFIAIAVLLPIFEISFLIE